MEKIICPRCKEYSEAPWRRCYWCLYLTDKANGLLAKARVRDPRQPGHTGVREWDEYNDADGSGWGDK